jgi:hypothetical protein
MNKNKIHPNCLGVGEEHRPNYKIHPLVFRGAEKLHSRRHKVDFLKLTTLFSHKTKGEKIPLRFLPSSKELGGPGAKL